MASRPVIQPLQATSTGGSIGSQLSSRNPYLTSAAAAADDEVPSRNPYHSPQQSPRRKPLNNPTTQAQALFSHPPDQTTRMSYPSSSEQPAAAAPPLPAKPIEYQSQTAQAPPGLPPRPVSECSQETHPALPPRPVSQLSEHYHHQDAQPALPPRPRSYAHNDEIHPSFTPPPNIPEVAEEPLNPPPAHHETFVPRNSSLDPVGQPPRRRLTTGDIPVTTVTYTRHHANRFVAYLLPLPAPTSQGQKLDVPQRYLLYTPPAPHLLKPGPDEPKERKRHRVKRLAQQETRKAKTYEGKTLSLRGLHSKTLRGVDWAVAAIKNSDITFFSRVPRGVGKAAAVDELVLIHPPVPGRTAEDVHAEFKDQLVRVKRQAAKHSAISIALFVPALVVDTLLVIVWPFGGLAEVDGVWAYASVSAWLAARSVSKRLDDKPIATADESGRLRLRRELSGEETPELSGHEDNGILRPVGEPPRPGSRTVRFQEELGEEEEDEKVGDDGMVNGKKKLKVRFVPDPAMETMDNYFNEILHKRNPRAFPSPGVPPTKTDVLASIGWWPDRRGRFPGTQQDGDWDDENWQTRQVKEDLDKVMKKAAKEWDKWCKEYAKHPKRAMKEKGHSRASEAWKKLRRQKDTPAPSEQQQQAPEAASVEAQSDATSGAQTSRKEQILAKLRARKESLMGGGTATSGSDTNRKTEMMEKLRARKHSIFGGAKAKPRLTI
ncbi:unnamed protein product [Discula destructiva]